MSAPDVEFDRLMEICVEGTSKDVKALEALLERLKLVKLSQEQIPCYCDDLEDACERQNITDVVLIWTLINRLSDGCAKWAPRQIRNAHIRVTENFINDLKAAGIELELVYK